MKDFNEAFNILWTESMRSSMVARRQLLHMRERRLIGCLILVKSEPPSQIVQLAHPGRFRCHQLDLWPPTPAPIGITDDDVDYEADTTPLGCNSGPVQGNMINLPAGSRA